MRKARRFLALMLSVMMVVTCVGSIVLAEEAVVAADKQNNFSDVDTNAVYLQAVKTLNLMGVINGYPDGTFGPDKNVTRAEFTAMLMRTLNYGGLGATTAAGLPFTDVDDNDSGINWAIPDINTAYAKGIINGYEDKTFRPNANVSYEEALKMIVCTLGYTLDVSGTPWYAEYVGQAGKLGITDVAYSLGKVETPASRACIAQMLYDSLEVNLVEKQEVTQKTILSDYLGYQKGRGVVASNGVSSLIAPDVLLRDNEVQIMSLEMINGNYAVYTYRTTDTEIKNYLGHEVEYYYKDDGSGIRNLVLYVVQDSNKLTIPADMIETSASSNTQIRYYTVESRGKTQIANLADDSIVLYNGKLYGATVAASRFNTTMIPQVGSVTLLDSDKDNKYDVVNIESYVVYYVSSKVASEYSIIDDLTKTGTDKKLILNVNDNSVKTTIVNASGSNVDYNAIGIGNIICLATSNAANGGEVLRKAVVVNDTVSGTVSSVETGSSVTIGGTKYSYSKAAPWLNGMAATMPEPALQDSGVYYKDINGDIVAYKANANVENIFYGYIIGMRRSDSAFDEAKEVRILNQSGSIVSALLTADVKIDGAPVVDVADAESKLLSSASIQNWDNHQGTADIHQVIKYTTRTTSAGTILDKVYTAQGTGTGVTVESNKLYFYNAITGATEMTYNSNSKKLTNSTSGAVLDVANSVVFVVPSDRGEYDGYAKKSLSAVFKNNGKYFVEAFDVSKTNSAKVVVCYGASAATDVDSTTPVHVLAKTPERATNSATGDVMTRIISFSSADRTAGTEKEAWLSATSLVPQLGDIYRPGTDKDGFAFIKDENLLYRVGREGSNPWGAYPASTLYTAEYAYVLGSVAAIDDTGFAVLPERVTDATPAENIDMSRALNFNFSSFANARVIRYNETGAEMVVEDVTADKDGILKGLVEYNAGVTNPSKVLIHMSYGSIKTICILDANA